MDGVPIVRQIPVSIMRLRIDLEIVIVLIQKRSRNLDKTAALYSTGLRLIAKPRPVRIESTFQLWEAS